MRDDVPKRNLHNAGIFLEPPIEEEAASIRVQWNATQTWLWPNPPSELL